MKFKKIYIEITNVCNMTCSFCPKLNRKKEFMTIETFEEILKKISGFTDYIYLHVKGEPFLHPKILEFLDLALAYNLKVNLTSNGTILIPKVLSRPALRQINFSLHSFEGDNEEEKEQYIKNILNFSDIAKKSGKIISLRLWNIEREKQNIGNNKTIKLIENFFGQNIEFQGFERGNGIKLAEKIYLNFEEVFEWPNLNNLYYEEKGFCHGLQTHIGILVDGTVIPCCLDDDGIINLGNIKEVSNLSDILAKEKTQNIIKGFKNRICGEELCKHCQFKERF